MTFWQTLITTASPALMHFAFVMLRVSMGILTIAHGYPKIMGGIETWRNLGTFMHPLGIYFLPLMWGFLGAAIEFFGGAMLTVGFGTRIASIALVLMMIVALVWHLSRGDGFIAYGLALTLIFVYAYFVITGGGAYSIDSYLSR